MPEEIGEVSLQKNSEEIEDIITAVPSWILRSGITVIFVVLLAIILLSAFIQYPDIVKTSLKITSLNAPKAVLVRQEGKLIRILVTNNQAVKEGQALAYIETTGSHKDVIELSKKLLLLRAALNSNQVPSAVFTAEGSNLGELQSNYQSFYQSYLEFNNTINGGYYLKKRRFLERDLAEIEKLKNNIAIQKEVQEQEYANAEQQYHAYKKLREKGVVSLNEFKAEENKYLSSKYPLQQTTTALLNNSSAYMAKEKEIFDLENTIIEQKAKFSQSLNVLINDVNTWMIRYVISAPVAGTVGFAGIIQENQNVSVNHELFIVNPGNTNFFGEIEIPQYNMGKVRSGQETLVKLRSYPFEQYGMIKGKLTELSDVALKDSVFTAKIEFQRFENKDPNLKVTLKNGMMADAEIITEQSTLLQRFTRNIVKMLNSN